MKSRQIIYLILLTAVMFSVFAVLSLTAENKTNQKVKISNAMLVDLFNKWERVWHEGQYNLIPDCVGQNYIRHDEKGDRTVTRAEYAAEIEQVHKERPGIRVVVYDHSFEGDRAWFRFAFKWTDIKTGEPRSRAGFQSYRIEGGKLAETWLSMQPLGSTWPDKVAQKHWTSPSPIK